MSAPAESKMGIGGLLKGLLPYVTPPRSILGHTPPAA